MSKPSERLKTLGIELPPPAKPVGSYVPTLQWGDLLMLSGQIGKTTDGGGKIGAPGGRTLEQGQEAARLAALNAIAVAADAVGGVDNLKRVVKLVVYVASDPDFTDQHKVANGASDLLAEIFGDDGMHVRAAVGVSALPLDATAEVDVMFAV